MEIAGILLAVTGSGLILLFILGIGLFLIYQVLRNALVGKKNQIENAFGTLDALLIKRCDLIPNLVATVKQYMEFEQRTLVDVTRYRSRAMSGQVTADERIELENHISRSIGNIMIAVEAYPELKADRQFQDLQGSLNEIEEQLSAARRFYNSAVITYNNAVEMFPTNLVASTMGYRPRRVLEATEQQRQAVNVASLFRS